MTDNEILPVIPEDIQALLERRSTYQDWLGKLEDVSADFRSEVAERVATDYEERLRGVEGELSTHRSALEDSLHNHRSAVEDLTRDHDARSAELEETELRHLVGEYTEDEYAARKEEHAGHIAQLDEALQRETDAVDELESVLREIAGAAAGVATSQADEMKEFEAEYVEEDSPPDASGDAGESGAAEPDAAAELERIDGSEQTDMDEVSWGEPQDEDSSEAVAEADAGLAEDDEGEETMPVTVEEPVAAAEDVEGDDFLDELEFLESLSIDEPVEFDSVSRLLDDEEAGGGEDQRSV